MLNDRQSCSWTQRDGEYVGPYYFFENVNDKTNEGLEYVGKKIFTVQFHPEACAGPQDTGYLFDRFMDMMKKED